MNPFKDISLKEGLKLNKKSPFYGRFNLDFDQVHPKSDYPGAIIKLNIIGSKSEFKSYVIGLIPPHLSHLAELTGRRQLEKEGEYKLSRFTNEDLILTLTMTGTPNYVNMESFYFLFVELSIFLEDCHFYIFSHDTYNERWIDKYRIIEGRLYFSRITLKQDLRFGKVQFYLESSLTQTKNILFKEFAINKALSSIESNLGYIRQRLSEKRKTINSLTEYFSEMDKWFKTLNQLAADNLNVRKMYNQYVSLKNDNKK